MKDMPPCFIEVLLYFLYKYVFLIVQLTLHRWCCQISGF